MRDVPWEDISKLSASTAAGELCEWVQVGTDVYIPHQKYRIKPHSSPWVLEAFAAAIVQINHFFRLYQQNKSSESKAKFRQASNHCKKVLEAAKIAYGNKIKSSSVPRNLALGTFCELSIFNKGNSPIPHLFSGPEVLSTGSDKAKLFAEKVS